MGTIGRGGRRIGYCSPGIGAQSFGEEESPLDARDFLFDMQTLEWWLRSTQYARSAVKFFSASAEEQRRHS